MMLFTALLTFVIDLLGSPYGLALGGGIAATGALCFILSMMHIGGVHND